MSTAPKNTKVVVEAATGTHLLIKDGLTADAALALAREDVIANIGPDERVFIETAGHRTFVRPDGGLHVVGRA